jgi:hypothetical protein
MESTRPTPGTVSPADTFRMPPGPSKTAVPSKASRTVQPAMVFGLVSGVGVSRGRNFFPARWTTTAAGFVEVAFCCTIDGTIFMGATAATLRLRSGSLFARGETSRVFGAPKAVSRAPPGAVLSGTAFCGSRVEVGLGPETRYKLHPRYPNPSAATSAPETTRSPRPPRGSTEITTSSRLGGLISGTHAGGASGIIIPI